MTHTTQKRDEGHTMKFQIVDQPEVRVPQDILLDGQVVGEIKHRDDGSLHASLRVPAVGATLVHAGLAQGFGSTEQEAIHDALASGEKNGRAYLAGVARLQALFGFADSMEAE